MSLPSIPFLSWHTSSLYRVWSLPHSFHPPRADLPALGLIKKLLVLGPTHLQQWPDHTVWHDLQLLERNLHCWDSDSGSVRPSYNRPWTRFFSQWFKSVIFKHCAVAHWCAVHGLEVCCGTFRRDFTPPCQDHGVSCQLSQNWCYDALDNFSTFSELDKKFENLWLK